MEVKTLDDLRYAIATFVTAECFDKKNRDKTSHEVFREFVNRELSFDAVAKSVREITEKQEEQDEQRIREETT